jgi:RNA polymerase sigma-70 factor (ECF subfamily)
VLNTDPPTTAADDGPAPTDKPSIDVGALFERDGDRVLAFTHRMLGNRADAEDAAQETFLRAHRRASTFQGDCAPSTWLFAIARNVCLDRLRARAPRRFAGLEDVIAQGHDAAAAGGHPDQAPAAATAERRWYVQAVREGCLLGTLACLSSDQRAAFVLRVLCDLSTKDTAAVLDRTENAVRVLTHRARGRLKAFLCRNCSLYDPANACRCENLVGFSLAQGWIGPDDRHVPRAQAATAAARAAGSIEDLARLASLYASLTTPELSPELTARIRSGMKAVDSEATGLLSPTPGD